MTWAEDIARLSVRMNAETVPDIAGTNLAQKVLA